VLHRFYNVGEIKRYDDANARFGQAECPPVDKLIEEENTIRRCIEG
jgi:hypothetical protein